MEVRMATDWLPFRRIVRTFVSEILPRSAPNADHGARELYDMDAMRFLSTKTRMLTLYFRKKQ